MSHIENICATNAVFLILKIFMANTEALWGNAYGYWELTVRYCGQTSLGKGTCCEKVNWLQLIEDWTKRREFMTTKTHHMVI
jgi:hypothetical protein